MPQVLLIKDEVIFDNWYGLITFFFKVIVRGHYNNLFHSLLFTYPSRIDFLKKSFIEIVMIKK